MVKQSNLERNYHIFYIMVAGASAKERESWELQPAQAYHYMNQSGCYDRRDGVKDIDLHVELQVRGGWLETINGVELLGFFGGKGVELRLAGLGRAGLGCCRPLCRCLTFLVESLKYRREDHQQIVLLSLKNSLSGTASNGTFFDELVTETLACRCILLFFFCVRC